MADKNGPKPSSGGTPQHTADNTPMHKLLAMGKNPKVVAEGKKTSA